MALKLSKLTLVIGYINWD